MPALLLFWVLLCAPAGAFGQERADPQLLAFINSIKAVDHHSHALPALNPDTVIPAPADPLGTSAPFFSVRQRETNPEWIEAWRALYGYAYQDASPEHVREGFSAKQRLRQEKGDDYPSWALDRAGIDIAFVNATSLGRGQTSPRFRWVPYGDGLLFPFPATDFAGNIIQRRRGEMGLDKPPSTLNEYIAIVSNRLREWKANGAVGVKIAVTYYRSLDFAPVAEADARKIYERYVQEGEVPPRDYRLADYRILQDYLFRYLAREAGGVGLPVHIHTGEGAGPVFPNSGSNPLLLESVLNDFSLAQTTFVLVHGGFPFDRAVSALIQKPNVYADVSGQTFFRSRRDLSETLRLWLWAFPEKVLFGTDAFTMTALRGWEEMTWLATRSGREALALALTQMIAAGDITRPRAEEVARMVLRDNAIRLYKLTP